MEKKKNIGFQFSGFRITAFSFKAPEEPLGENESFDFETSVGVSHESSALIVKVGIVVQRSLNQVRYASMITETLFSIEGLDIDNLTGAVVDVPTDFYAMVISLAISTTRGALLVKGAGSFLERVPLPIVDPKPYAQAIMEADKPS